MVAADKPTHHAQESLEGIGLGVYGYDVLGVREEVREPFKQGSGSRMKVGKVTRERSMPLPGLSCLIIAIMIPFCSSGSFSASGSWDLCRLRHRQQQP